MPSVLSPSGSPTVPATLTVPTAGDAVSAGAATPMRTAYQAILDGLAALNTLTGTTGVKRLRSVSSSAALKALTGMAADDVAMVTSVSVFGIYKFVSSAPAGSDVGAIRYDATDGSGFWINAIYSLVTFTGGASGTATRLNASGLAVPNRIVSLTVVSEASPTYLEVASATGSFDDVGFATGNISLQIGDIVKIVASGSMTNESSTFVKGRIAVVDPTPTTTGIVGSEMTATATAAYKSPMTMVGSFTATAAGNHSFKVQLLGSAGNVLRMYADRYIEALLIRP